MSHDTTTRRIVGALISGGRLFRSGDEAAFAAYMHGRSTDHLTANGQIVGDWSASTDTPDDAAPALADLTKAQLVAYAASVGLELDASARKDALLDAITAHEALGSAGTDDATA